MARAVESGPIFGKYGLSKLAYSGEVTGKWKGAETCTMYKFGPDKRASWVDPRDQAVLLDQKDNEGEPLFTLVIEAKGWNGRLSKGN